MAIQVRRGNFNKFDPTKLLPGEWAVVLSGDAESPDGKAVYICFSAGNVKRMSTIDEIVGYIEAANEAAERATEAAEAAEGIILDAVPTMSATVKGGAMVGDGLEVVDQTLSVSPATSSEIGGVKPDGTTITADADGTIHGANTYVLPPATTSTLGGVKPDGTTVTVDQDGTIHGASQVSPISDATIDAVVSDQSPTGTDSLQTTGLSYLWTKLKAAFASITHTHTVLGDSSTKTVTVNANGVAECSGTATGSNSHAEGNGTTAAGEASHTEGAGAQTSSSARASHAEGSQTAVTAEAAHAEGRGSTASGIAAHSEGQQAQAWGAASHAEGTGTIAGSASQHVSGKYNVTDSSDVYAEIVGNGTNLVESNARTLDWDGNAWHAGEVSATETLNGSPVTHNLTEKADRDGYTWGQAKSRFTWGSVRGQSSTGDATTTTNLGMTKPGYASTLDVAALNGDLDTLDAAIGAVDVQTDGSLQEQIDDLESSVNQHDVIDNYTASIGSMTTGQHADKTIYITDRSSSGYEIASVTTTNGWNGSIIAYISNIANNAISTTVYCLNAQGSVNEKVKVHWVKTS